VSIAISDLVELLGGATVLRARVTSELDLARIIAEVLPTGAVRSAVEHGVLSNAETGGWLRHCAIGPV